MRPKKNGHKRKAISTQAELLGAIVKSRGSGAAVSEELGCSQQSVSEWMRGSWPPRAKMQDKMHKLYGIPKPWPSKSQ